MIKRLCTRVFGQEVLTPEAQLAVSREYLAVFFLAQLGGGSNGASAATVREARRRMWGDESWTAGGGMSRMREDVRQGRFSFYAYTRLVYAPMLRAPVWFIMHSDFTLYTRDVQVVLNRTVAETEREDGQGKERGYSLLRSIDALNQDRENVRINGPMYGSKKWTKGPMDQWINGSMDRWTNNT